MTKTKEKAIVQELCQNKEDINKEHKRGRIIKSALIGIILGDGSMLQPDMLLLDMALDS